jgi:hypothetical protein
VLALQDDGLGHTSLQPCFPEPLSVCIQHGTVPAGRARRRYRRHARRCPGEDVGHRLTAHRIPGGAIPWATRRVLPGPVGSEHLYSTALFRRFVYLLLSPLCIASAILSSSAPPSPSSTGRVYICSGSERAITGAENTCCPVATADEAPPPTGAGPGHYLIGTATHIASAAALRQRVVGSCAARGPQRAVSPATEEVLTIAR